MTKKTMVFPLLESNFSICARFNRRLPESTSEMRDSAMAVAHATAAWLTARAACFR